MKIPAELNGYKVLAAMSACNGDPRAIVFAWHEETKMFATAHLTPETVAHGEWALGHYFANDDWEKACFDFSQRCRETACTRFATIASAYDPN